MNSFLLLLDLAPGPVELGSGVIVILIIIMGLSVAFAGGLVVLLIWLKRRQANASGASEPAGLGAIHELP
ncbi:MAG TPA: hypothetical protein VMS31_01095 [Pyrinomonadaceae bacterium]|nr:hypothetical protein [Pyrinomonadaceae bacterium]